MFTLLFSRRPRAARTRRSRSSVHPAAATRAGWRPHPVTRLGRRPALWWTAAGVVAVATLAATHHLVTDAAARRAAWGDTVSVVVTIETVAAGAPLDGANTEVVDLPVAAVADDALPALPAGAAAAVALGRGEIVVASRLVGFGDTARVGVAVPLGALAGLVSVGDVVDVWAGADPYAIDATATSPALVAAGVAVIDQRDDVALVAVDPDDAGAVAAAVAQVPVSVTVVVRG